MTTLTVWVPGNPAPQGSKRHVGRGILIEQSKRVGPWREQIRAATLLAPPDWWTPIATAADVTVTFSIPRPSSHYGTGRNAGTLRPSAPQWPTSRRAGDNDKLQRALLDGLVAGGALADDSLVVHIDAWKVYQSPAGAHVEIREVA